MGSEEVVVPDAVKPIRVRSDAGLERCPVVHGPLAAVSGRHLSRRQE